MDIVEEYQGYIDSLAYEIKNNLIPGHKYIIVDHWFSNDEDSHVIWNGILTGLKDVPEIFWSAKILNKRYSTGEKTHYIDVFSDILNHKLITSMEVSKLTQCFLKEGLEASEIIERLSDPVKVMESIFSTT